MMFNKLFLSITCFLLYVICYVDVVNVPMNLRLFGVTELSLFPFNDDVSSGGNRVKY